MRREESRRQQPELPERGHGAPRVFAKAELALVPGLKQVGVHSGIVGGRDPGYRGEQLIRAPRRSWRPERDVDVTQPAGPGLGPKRPCDVEHGLGRRAWRNERPRAVTKYRRQPREEGGDVARDRLAAITDVACHHGPDPAVAVGGQDGTKLRLVFVRFLTLPVVDVRRGRNPASGELRAQPPRLG